MLRLVSQADRSCREPGGKDMNLNDRMMQRGPRISAAGRFALLICMASFLLCSAAFADTPVARLTTVTGEVSTRHGDAWQNVAAAPADLFSGDKVVTQRGRAEILYLDDGSTLTLDVGPNVTVNAPQPRRGGALLG